MLKSLERKNFKNNFLRLVSTLVRNPYCTDIMYVCELNASPYSKGASG